jgi:hypothetical protein
MRIKAAGVVVLALGLALAQLAWNVVLALLALGCAGLTVWMVAR